MDKKSEEQNEEIRFLKLKLKDLQKASINSTNPSSQTNNKTSKNNSVPANKNSNLDAGINIISNEHNEIISSKKKLNIFRYQQNKYKRFRSHLFRG